MPIQRMKSLVRSSGGKNYLRLKEPMEKRHSKGLLRFGKILRNPLTTDRTNPPFLTGEIGFSTRKRRDTFSFFSYMFYERFAWLTVSSVEEPDLFIESYWLPCLDMYVQLRIGQHEGTWAWNTRLGRDVHIFTHGNVRPSRKPSSHNDSGRLPDYFGYVRSPISNENQACSCLEECRVLNYVITCHKPPLPPSPPYLLSMLCDFMYYTSRPGLGLRPGPVRSVRESRYSCLVKPLSQLSSCI